MKVTVWLPLIAVLALTCSCATVQSTPVPFAQVELTQTVPRTTTNLISNLWCNATKKLLIRHSALFEFKGKQVPIAALMKLDLTVHTARLVAMNEMGVKLYDISIGETSSQVNFIINDLAQYPGFTEAVAISVRRIFLTHAPSSGEKLERTLNYHILTSAYSGGTATFTFGGAHEQMLEKSMRSSSESWRVRYFEYKWFQGGFFPGGITLDDDLASYRLTIWIESVDEYNE
jgi:hypothetical protein